MSFYLYCSNNVQYNLLNKCSDKSVLLYAKKDFYDEAEMITGYDENVSVRRWGAGSGGTATSLLGFV